MVPDGRQRRWCSPEASLTGTLLVLAACVAAAVVSWIVLSAPAGRHVELGDVLPRLDNYVAGRVTTSIGPTPREGTPLSAQLILIGLPIVAGLPLLAPPRHRRTVTLVAAVALTVFAVVTILRLGIVYLPAAGLLIAATMFMKTSDS